MAPELLQAERDRLCDLAGGDTYTRADIQMLASVLKRVIEELEWEDERYRE